MVLASGFPDALVTYGILFLLGLLSSVAITPAVRRFALRIRVVDMPGGRRVHSTPTPRLGGVAVYVSLGLSLGIGSLLAGTAVFSVENGWRCVALAVAATAITAVGVFDDAFSLSPRSKLAAEILAGIITVAAGYQIDAVFGLRLGWLAPPLTVFWVVAVVNAVNMVDGLDGLATGTCLIVGTTLLFVSGYRHENSVAFLAVFCGVLAGFLRYNFTPAKIFLGDSGSLLLGFLIAVLGIESAYKAAVSEAIIVPILALGLPLTEITVTVIRRFLKVIRVGLPNGNEGRYRYILSRPAIFAADEEHIHHRLVALGFSGLSAVLLLYAVSATLCGAALYFIHGRPIDHLATLLAVAVIGAVALAQLRYEEFRVLKRGLLLPMLDLDPSLRRRVSIIADLIFAAVAYFSASLAEGYAGAPSFLILIIPAIQVGCFVLGGLYRRSYRYGGTEDFLVMLRVLVFASAAAWFTAWAICGWGNPSVGVLVIDDYVLMTWVLGSRLAFRVVDRAFTNQRTSEHRALIFGTGASACLAMEHIRSDPSLGLRVVGFVDDDERTPGGYLLAGLPILKVQELEALPKHSEFDELVLAPREGCDEARLSEILARCREAKIGIRRFSIGYDEVQVPAQARRPGPANGDKQHVRDGGAGLLLNNTDAVK